MWSCFRRIRIRKINRTWTGRKSSSRLGIAAALAGAIDFMNGRTRTPYL